ncbi:hypothetical protein [Streptomyces sp. MN13]
MTELADAYGGPGRCASWHRAAQVTVRAAVRALSVADSTDVFQDAAAVAQRRIDEYRLQGDMAGLSAALVDAARLRMAASTRLERAGDEYAEAEPHMMSCGEARRQWRTTQGARGAMAELDLLERKVEAVRLLTEALPSTDGASRALALLSEARLGSVPRPREALAAARADGLDPAVALGLFRLAGSRPMTRAAAHVFDGDSGALADRIGPGPVRDVISQGIAIARAVHDRRLLARVLEWADRLGGDDDDAFVRQIWEARLHSGALVSCGMSEKDVAKLARRLLSGDTHMRDEDVLHLAAHVREAGLADLGQELLERRGALWLGSAAARLVSADLHQLAARAGTPNESVPFPQLHYAMAAAAYSELGLFDLAGASLAAFRSWLLDIDGDALRFAILTLTRLSPRLNGTRNREFAATMRDTAHSAVWQAVRHSESMSLVYLLCILQVAKGAEFARWYGVREPLAESRATAVLLGRLREVEARVEAASWSPTRAGWTCCPRWRAIRVTPAAPTWKSHATSAASSTV